MNKIIIIVFIFSIYSCSNKDTVTDNSEKVYKVDTLPDNLVTDSTVSPSTTLSIGNEIGDLICSGESDDLTTELYNSLVFDYTELLAKKNIHVTGKENYYNDKYKSHDTLITIEYDKNVYKFYVSSSNQFLLSADIINQKVYSKDVQKNFFINKKDFIKKSNIKCDLDKLKITDGFYQVEIGIVFKGDTVNEIVIETNP